MAHLSMSTSLHFEMIMTDHQLRRVPAGPGLPEVCGYVISPKLEQPRPVLWTSLLTNCCAAMAKNRHHYFRFTPRTARITFLYVAVIPAIVGYVAYQTDVSFELRQHCMHH